MQSLKNLMWHDFIENYWPNNSEEFSTIEWDEDTEEWCIEHHEAKFTEADENDSIGASDPFELYAALKTITDEMSQEQAEEIINDITYRGECYYEGNPKDAPYWQDFDFNTDDVWDDSPEDNHYVYHASNGVLTNRGALEAWAEEHNEKTTKNEGKI